MSEPSPRVLEELDRGMTTVLASGFMLLLFNDLWFYGVHRLLHRPFLFKHIHSTHHRSRHVTPLSSYSFHVAEAMLVTAWLVPAMFVC